MKIRTETKMRLDYFNDFYVIEALKANIAMSFSDNPALQFSHSIERLMRDIDIYAKEFIPNLAKRVFVYVYVACLGEARHAMSSLSKDFYFAEICGGDRSNAFQQALDIAPSAKNVDAIIAAFEQEWRGSFGGKKWLTIAKSLRMYFEESNESFLDHVIDLQHNTGTVFNKSEAESIIQFGTGYDGIFSEFLDYKFRRNILKYPCDYTMMVTRKTRNLLDRYEVIYRSKPIKWMMGHLKTLTEYEVQWGNNTLTKVKKWIEWADCSKGNRPNVEWLVYQKGLSSLSVWGMTEKKLTKRLDEIKNRAARVLKNFEGDYSLELEKVIENKFKRYSVNCKMRKCALTYQLLPVKIKTTGSYITVQVPAKYYGHGVETDYGFVVIGKAHGIIAKGKEKGFDGKRGYETAIAKSEGIGHKLTLKTHSNTWYYPDKQLEALFT